MLWRQYRMFTYEQNINIFLGILHGNYTFRKYKARNKKLFMHISNHMLAWAELNSSTSEYDAAGHPGATTTVMKKQTNKQKTACTVPKCMLSIRCTVVTRTLALTNTSSSYSSGSTKRWLNID